MTTKFKIGDKVQQITVTENYFVVKAIHIDSSGIYYGPREDIHMALIWNENELQLKKEKVKKYRYLFINPHKSSFDVVAVTPEYYATDADFHYHYPTVKDYTKTEFAAIEVEL